MDNTSLDGWIGHGKVQSSRLNILIIDAFDLAMEDQRSRYRCHRQNMFDYGRSRWDVCW